MGSWPTAGRSSTANPDSVRGGNFDPVDSPMLSPVHKVDALGCEEYIGFVSSQSDLFDSVDYTSSRTSCPEIDDVKSEPFSLLDISKTYSNLGFGFFDLPLEKKKKKRRQLKKTTRNSINQEFDDLDEFQLSID
ncbi:hypothetical protein LSH36_195g03073 [Paralvinella palmiformis]|uniref:Uncharacterized protein n=1 Tax=Paralvinella palmiformis TaxID=53620 RepID=A0AAD9JQT0_9ANNE|nr:hypothetical protein LSH36_195g03073 [Paralvinella palmiformis]